MLLFINRYGDAAIAPLLIYFFRFVCWYDVVEYVERNYDLFRLFKVTFRLFAIDNLCYPSLLPPKAPQYSVVLTSTPSTHLSKMKDIKY
jgi:hypothetical protein